MNSNNIKPEKVTKPIQLLAAWLTGMILINTTFLTAASQITTPSWTSGLLIIAAVLNVPLFLFSIFLLQTRFRPEMQEDTFYSQYLERKYNGEQKEITVSKLDINTNKIAKEIIEKINSTQKPQEKEKEVLQILRERDIQIIKNEVESSRSLSELYSYPDKWHEIIESWGESTSFKNDIEKLYKYEIISGDVKNSRKIKLTTLGKKIASELQSENKLWNQNHERHIGIK